MTDLTDLSLTEVLAKLRAKEFSSVEITQAYLDKIHQYDPVLKSFITVTDDLALSAAKAADKAIADGDDRPMLGVPMSLKDILSTTGVETTAGSKILRGYKHLFNATADQRLFDAGMVMLGKVNLDEFAMGSSTENSGLFVTRNPWDPERVPGGSSGGSAAAVAAGFGAASLGTDTGGSVRQPGAFCGVTALKPSYGRVSRYGLIAFGSSLDQIGPFGRSVEDVARVLGVMAGHDPLDSTSMPTPVPNYIAEMQNTDIKGLKIGLPKEYFVDGVVPVVRDAVQAAIDKLVEMGAETVEISLPHTEYGLPVYYILATSEASTNLARFDGIRFGPKIDKGNMWDTYRATRGEGFGPEVKRRIMLGTYALSAGYYDAFYGKAQGVRTLIKQDFEKAFETVDIIATPVTPTPAFKFGENTDDPIQMYLSDIFTMTTNLAGIAGISIPCGMDTEHNLPIGLQLLGPHMGESEIFRVGHAYQQATDWHTRRPPLAETLKV